MESELLCTRENIFPLSFHLNLSPPYSTALLVKITWDFKLISQLWLKFNTDKPWGNTVSTCCQNKTEAQTAITKHFLIMIDLFDSVRSV